MRRNGYLGASGQKSNLLLDPATLISNKGLIPLHDDVCGIYVVFMLNFHVTL